MNAVRSYFATAVAFLVVAIGWWAADAEICCNSSTFASGGGDVCRNKNRTFHTVEAFVGDKSCDDNRTAVPIRKCCPLGQEFLGINCGNAGADGDKLMRRMMQLLRDKFRAEFGAVSDTVMVGYNYEGLVCDAPNNLYDMFEDKIIRLIATSPSDLLFPFCFDVTYYGALWAKVCSRAIPCHNNTCVNSCCSDSRMIVDGPNVPECGHNRKPFTMHAYEIDGDGRQVGRSNKTVLPHPVEFKCSHRDMLEYGFQLSEDDSLYLTYEHRYVPFKEYCVGYSEGIVTDTIVAYICNADTVFMVERTRASSIPIFFRASYVVSAVCLALTLLIYTTLPSFRNIRNYYVKCYLYHQFVSCICVICQMIVGKETKKEKCLLYGYITLFVFISTLCWLNVICLDIYWRIRYNISRNRNTSTSIRSIMYYSYCWGLPSIFVCTGFFFLISHDESLQGLAPIFEVTGYGCFYCHMSDYEGFFFILLPVFVMLAANLILFLLTAIHCSRVKSELNTFNPTDSKTEHFLIYKQKFVMSIKLFLIIGIPYLFTVLSIILRMEGTKWNIIYVASSLQGVLIFITFVAKHQVIMDLRKKFKGSMDHSDPTQTNLNSGSSQ
ncbi:unnamed protein product [Macrosiphum euphorbiae]|uniref:G-protein coupled receptors family 2 profile 2 domain-containing protein n=1 Tax=Macrosiphum euphorbiae TaxID=13131 RepID=A0AAV0WF95_9HEMI|nr:unnamed protein product [Macrosiphum euphorbiae]